jgi:uncharacterized cupin superfamily protein
MLVAQAEGTTPVRPGERAGFRVHCEAAHLFDDSGKALPRIGLAVLPS